MGDDIDEIIRIIKHAANQGVKHAAEIIGGEIHEAFDTAIEHFYADYDPVRYRRTYSLPKAYFGVGGKDTFYRQKSQMCYYAGMDIGSEYIPGEPYEKNPQHGWYMSKYIVFTRAFEEGKHGFVKSEVNLINQTRTKWDYWRPKTIPTKSKPIQTEFKSKFDSITKIRRMQGIMDEQIMALLDGL